MKGKRPRRRQGHQPARRRADPTQPVPVPPRIRSQLGDYPLDCLIIRARAKAPDDSDVVEDACYIRDVFCVAEKQGLLATRARTTDRGDDFTITHKGLISDALEELLEIYRERHGI